MAELVGISSTTSTAPAAYRLAHQLGQASVPVVMGGPHVTFRADEARHAPYAVRGERARLQLQTWKAEDGSCAHLAHLQGLLR